MTVKTKDPRKGRKQQDAELDPETEARIRKFAHTYVRLYEANRCKLVEFMKRLQHQHRDE